MAAVASSAKAKTKRIRAALCVSTLPRLGTHIALARAFQAAGHDTVVCIYDSLRDQIDEARHDFSGAEVVWLAEPNLRSLDGIDVFFGTETLHNNFPQGAVNVGVIHSIPDSGLGPDGIRSNSQRVFKMWPRSIRTLDYLAVAIRQKPSHWTARNYALLDQVYPAGLLEGRQPKLGIIPAGYPKLEYSDDQLSQDVALDTILYSPTSKASRIYRVDLDGERIIGAILKAFPKMRIVMRPYPRDADIAAAREVAAKFEGHDRFDMDLSATGAEVQARAAAVVSDSSSSAMTFALSSKRPLVFAKLENESGKGRVSAQALKALRNALGYTVTSETELVAALRSAIGSSVNWASEIDKARADNFYNPQGAAAYLAQALPTIARREMLPDWLAVDRTGWTGSDLDDHIRWIRDEWATQYGIRSPEAVIDEILSLTS